MAHRLSTIQKMDRILVMENGKIIEEGSHKELINKTNSVSLDFGRIKLVVLLNKGYLLAGF